MLLLCFLHAVGNVVRHLKLPFLEIFAICSFNFSNLMLLLRSWFQMPAFAVVIGAFSFFVCSIFETWGTFRGHVLIVNLVKWVFELKSFWAHKLRAFNFNHKDPYFQHLLTIACSRNSVFNISMFSETHVFFSLWCPMKLMFIPSFSLYFVATQIS